MTPFHYEGGAVTEPNQQFPDGAELTHLLVVSELSRSVAFYRDVMGAELVREYGGTSAVFRCAGTWLLLVTGISPRRRASRCPWIRESPRQCWRRTGRRCAQMCADMRGCAQRPSFDLRS
jgi:Glyoxalase/Bleomycin resistance protein/Dioxygenase superfamily